MLKLNLFNLIIINLISLNIRSYWSDLKLMQRLFSHTRVVDGQVSCVSVCVYVCTCTHILFSYLDLDLKKLAAAWHKNFGAIYIYNTKLVLSFLSPASFHNLPNFRQIELQLWNMFNQFHKYWKLRELTEHFQCAFHSWYL